MVILTIRPKAVALFLEPSRFGKPENIGDRVSRSPIIAISYIRVNELGLLHWSSDQHHRIECFMVHLNSRIRIRLGDGTATLLSQD